MGMQDMLRLVRQAYKTFNLIAVTTTACPTCGYTAFTDGAKTIPCAQCGGAGEIPVLSIHRIHGRWSFVQLTAVDAYKGVPPGVESGDLMLWVAARDKAEMDTVFHSKDGYVEVEGNTFVLGGENPDGVGSPDEYCYIARKRKPSFTYG
jgi:hypothetical protein